jgi:hypothetical protein
MSDFLIIFFVCFASLAEYSHQKQIILAAAAAAGICKKVIKQVVD